MTQEDIERVVKKDCQARNLNKEDAIWKKLLKIG